MSKQFYIKQTSFSVSLAIGMLVIIFGVEMCSCVCVCYSLAKCCCKINEDDEVRRRCRKVLYEVF